MTGRRARVIGRVSLERDRQEIIHERTCASDDVTDAERLAVLVEEVGEIARAILDSVVLDTTPAEQGNALRDELVQVAAVAVAWLEHIEAAS